MLKRPGPAKESIQAAIYLNPLSFEITQRYLDVLRQSGELTKQSRRGDRDGG